jgi:hypothetical protein
MFIHDREAIQRSVKPSAHSKIITRYSGNRGGHALYQTCGGRSSLFRATPRRGPTRQAHRSKARHTGRQAVREPAPSDLPGRYGNSQRPVGGLYKAGLCAARPTRRHCGASSGGSATPSTPGCALTPAKPPQRPPRTREGNRGTTLTPARPARTPRTGSSDQPLPGLRPAYEPRQRSRRPSRRPGRRRRKPGEPLDNDDNKEDSICAAGKAGGLARDIAQVWGLWASGTAAATGSSRAANC